MRTCPCIGLVALLCGALCGQSTEKFEIADVHASGPSVTPFPFARGPFLRAGRYEMRGATMVDLVRTAYGVDADKVVGGPNWLEMDRFDVIAKAPERPTAETLKTMLRELLLERFKLVAHEDKKPLAVYSLKAGKHQGLKEADSSGETGCKFQVEGGGPGRGGPGEGAPPPGPPTIVYTCRKTTMETFANGLRNIPFAPQYLNGRAVVDETELKGVWDFTLKYSFRGGPLQAGTDVVTMFNAIEKLGLRLEPATLPTAVVVVDSVSQKPSPNPPGMAETLLSTPLATEFEVAEIKVTDPDFKGMMMQNQPGGRLNMRGMPLKFIIQQAWGIIGDEMIVGFPKSLDSARFDIIAKAPTASLVNYPATPGATARPANIDFDSMWLMLRALLEDRFKMKSHREDRPLDAYSLIAGKPKMKKADPSSRTSWKEGPGADGKDPRNTNPALSRLINAQNLTMAQFASMLQAMAPGYIHSPVVDSTGLAGGWDFMLNFSPAGMERGAPGRGGDAGFVVGGGAAGPPGASATASDPTGGITLFDAMEKQLGLKLEKQKRPVSVLVIDHIEEKPTDN